MQKNQWKGPNFQIQCFYNERSLTDRSSLLKTPKTRETKTWITQNFELVWPIQGRTMWKLTSWGFRKCGSFRDLEVLNQSYRLSKSSQISKKKNSENGCHKKKTRAQFLIKSLFLLREVSKLDLKTSLRRNKDLKKKLCACYFFLTSLIFRDESTFAALFRLWAAITMALIIRTPKCHTYSESWVRALSHGPILVKFFFTKFSRRSERSKKFTFLQFSVSPPPEQSNGPPFGQYWRQRASR